MAVTADKVVVELEAKIDGYTAQVEDASAKFTNGMSAITGAASSAEKATSASLAGVSGSAKKEMDVLTTNVERAAKSFDHVERAARLFRSDVGYSLQQLTGKSRAEMLAFEGALQVGTHALEGFAEGGSVIEGAIGGLFSPINIAIAGALLLSSAIEHFAAQAEKAKEEAKAFDDWLKEIKTSGLDAYESVGKLTEAVKGLGLAEAGAKAGQGEASIEQTRKQLEALEAQAVEFRRIIAAPADLQALGVPEIQDPAREAQIAAFQKLIEDVLNGSITSLGDYQERMNDLVKKFPDFSKLASQANEAVDKLHLTTQTVEEIKKQVEDINRGPAGFGAATPGNPIYLDKDGRSVLGGFQGTARAAEDSSMDRLMQVQHQDMEKLLEAVLAHPSAFAKTITDAPKEFLDAYLTAAARYKLDPNLLISQGYQETGGFRPDVVSGQTKSPSGTIGIAQFMPGTAADLGVDPTDPIQSIFAQAKYDRQLLDQFGGNIAKMLMGYNWGPGNVADWEKAGGNVASIPKETQGYLKNILTPGADAGKQTIELAKLNDETQRQIELEGAKGQATLLAANTQQLMNKYIAAGITLTPELTKQIQAQAAELTNNQLADKQKKIDDEEERGTALLKARSQILGMTHQQEVLAAETQKLMNQYVAAGIPLNEKNIEIIKGLANARAQQVVADEAAAKAERNLISRMDDIRNTAKDALGTFVSDLEQGRKAAEALKDALMRVIDALLNAAENSLIAKLFGEQGTADGGMFGNIIGGLFGGGGLAPTSAPNIPVIPFMARSAAEPINLHLTHSDAFVSQIADRQIVTHSGTIINLSVKKAGEQSRRNFATNYAEAQARVL